MEIKPQIKKIFRKTNSRQLFLLGAAIAVFTLALIIRLPYISHGLDQWDEVHYKDSLVHMQFDRPAKWPVLLFIQKGIWLILAHHSAATILSFTSLLMASATLAMFFILAKSMAKSYISSLILTVGLFFTPVFAVYSVIGMQDMAQTFGITLAIFLLLTFCYNKKIYWLYAACAAAGLIIGIKLTLVLFVPSLILASLLMVDRDYKKYLKIFTAFAGGVLLWFIPEQFMKANAGGSVSFFFEQVYKYNPAAMGYWKKAGDYVLLTGYNFRNGMFYWLPVLWLLIYLLAKRNKKTSIGSLVALFGVLISLATSYGLHIILSKPYTVTFYVMASVTTVGIIYELFRFLPHVKDYVKKANNDEHEMAIIVLTTLIASYFVFEYAFAGAVTRYLLPIIPALLLLMVLLSGLKKLKSIPLALIIVAWGFWGSSFSHTQKIISTFKTIDTRSSVSLFAKAHPGIYYSYDMSLAVYFDTYKVSSPLKPMPANACLSVRPTPYQYDYLVFNGPAPAAFMNGCPYFHFIKVASFTRHEEVIEDSVGNRGYFIYEVVPG